MTSTPRNVLSVAQVSDSQAVALPGSSRPTARSSYAGAMGLETLEQRTMMSGDVLRASIVFVSNDVAGTEGMLQSRPGVEVVYLNSRESEFDQISQALAGRTGLDSIQFLTHGSSGRISLGADGRQQLTAAALDANAGTVRSWGQALAADGDILLFGCDVGAGAIGKSFIERLSALTGADVAASNNLTGSAKLGGDWNLEVKVGKVDAAPAFDISAYAFTLAAPTISGAVAAQAVSETATIRPFDAVVIGTDTPSGILSVSVTLDTAAKGIFTSASLTSSGFAFAGGGVYTFTGTAAQATTALARLDFDPTNNRVNTASTETTTFTISASDGINAATTDSTTTVVSTAANERSTISGSASGQTVNDNATIAPFAAVTVGDPDSPAQSLTVTVALDAAAKGIFNSASLIASGFTDNADGTYSFTGSAAAATTAIRQLIFVPTANRVTVGSTETTTLSIIINDGVASPTFDGSTSIVATSINNAPGFAGASAGQTVNDNATIQPFSGLTITDPDPTQQLTVRIVLDTAAKGVFSAATLATSGFTNLGGGQYTFIGTAAQSTTAIRQLVFVPTANRVAVGATETTTFTVTADDNVATAVSNGTTTVVSTSINNAPAIAGTSGGQTVNDNATTSPFAAVTIADIDPGTSLIVTVTLDTAAKGAFTPASLTASGFADSGGGIYTFTGSAAAATTAIRALVYDPTNNRAAVAGTETSTFTISVNDSVAAAVTDTATTIISTSVNDAPTITGAVANQAVNDNATVSPFTGLAIDDLDISTIVTVTITLDLAAKGVFTPASLATSGFADAGGGAYTFTGTPAAATTAIAALVFRPTANRVRPALTETTTFSVAVSDGIAAATTNTATTVISTGVNDAPTISGAAAGQAVSDNATRSPFTGVTIGDVDPSTTLNVSVTIDDATKGVFTTASLTASGFVSAGGGVYTFSGSPAAATTAIRALVFAPTANRVAVASTETSTFTVAADDAIAAAVTNNTTTVVSTSVNDAPTIAGATSGQSVNDNATRSPFSGIAIADADPSSSLTISVTIDSAAKGVFTAASLTASGFTDAGSGVYTFTGSPTAATTAIRALSFDPTNNRAAVASTETSTFTISVSDGVAAAVTNNTTTVISTSINDAPTISGAAASQAVNDNATLLPFSGLTIGDVDPGTTLVVSVTLDAAAKGVFTAGSLASSGFIAAGGGVYTFTGTPAAATLAIRALVFDPADNRVNPALTETSTFTISTDDGIASAVTNNTTTVISTSINDAPAITGAASGQAISDISTNTPFSGVTISDADAAQTLSVTVTIDTASKGVFTPASLTASGFISAGAGVYTFSGTAAQATTAIRALVFNPSDNQVASGTTQTSTFTVAIDDGIAAAVTDASTTVISTNVNDLPGISGTVASQAVNDNATVLPFTAVTIADVDPGTTLGVTVTLDVAARGIFTAGSLTASGFISAGSGTYTFSGSPAAATTAIRQLVFAPTANRVAPGLTDTTRFTISASDGAGGTPSDTVTTVVSTSVNDAPAITGTAAGQAVNDNATNSPFSATTIGDADPSTTLSVSVAIDAPAKGAFTTASLTASGFVNAGGGVYTFTGTAAAATTAIRALVFAPSANRVAVASTETSTFTITASDGVAAATIDSTTTVVSTSINDAPTVTGAIAGQTVSDTATVSPFSAISFADVDPSTTLTITVTIDTAAKGVFTPASLTASGFTDAGGGVYTFTGTATASTVAIRALVYNPADNRVASGSTETSIFTVSASDGVAAAVSNSTTTVISTSINDAPTIGGAAASQAVSDDSTISPFSAMTLGDVDPSASISVTVTLDSAAKGVFTPASLTSSGFVHSGGGVYTFTGSAAAATTAIRALVFAPTANRVNPALTETSTFTVAISDGIASAVTSNVTTVISTSVNDAPTISGATAGQAVNDNATRSPFAGITIGDADSAQSLSISVTIDNAAKGIFTTASLTASGFVNAGGGVYTFTGTAAAATTAIRALVFAPTVNRVAVGVTDTSTFTISASDAVAAAATNSATTVISTSINDAPTITGAVFGQTVNDNNTIALFSGMTIGDVDPSSTLTVTVTIDSAAKGVFTAGSLTSSGFTDAGSGVYTFTGTAAAATTAIRALLFDPTNNRVAAGSFETSTFTVAANDSIAASVTNTTTTVLSGGVNDAPTITGAAAGQTVNDSALISPFAAITIADVDPGQSQSIAITLDATAKGVFTPASLTASGFVDVGGGVYTFTGTAAAATTAIRALVFNPTDNRGIVGTTETTGFTVSVTDGIASAVTDSSTTVVSTSINDAPAITGAAAGQTVTDTATVSPFSGVTITDADVGAALTVTITLDTAAKGFFTAGSLTASGFVDSGGGIYTFTGTPAAATTAIRGLVFDPANNRVAVATTETTTFTISASDSIAAPTTSSTTTVVSTNVNDAPTVTGTAAGQAVNDNSTISPFTGVTLGDVDPSTSLTVSVTLDTAAKGIFTSVSLTASGFVSAGGGVYTFTGTPVAATTAIRALVFAPTANRVTPSLTEISTFTISAGDGVAAAVTSSTTTVVSTSVNDAPTVTGTASSQAVNDNASRSIFAAVTIGDADSNQSLSVSVSIDDAAKGAISAASLLASGFSNFGGGVYTFTGTAAAATTAIRHLIFAPVNNRIAVSTVEISTFTIAVSDAVAATVSNSSTTVVSISINDAPAMTGAAANQAVSDASTIAPFSALTIADGDSPAQSLSVTVTLSGAANGVFTAGSLTASGFASGGGGIYTFSGTAADATTAIRQLVFQPTAGRAAIGSTETTTFTVSADDSFTTTNNSTSSVVSTPVNDPTTITGAASSQAVNDNTTISPFTAVTIGDVNSTQSLTVTVTQSAAANGDITSASLTNSGFTSLGGGIYRFIGTASAATTAIRALVFAPTANRTVSGATETTGFTIASNDGLLAAVTNATTTVISTNVNDAPAITGASSGQAVSDTATVSPFAGVTFIDVDTATVLSISVTIDAAAKGVFTPASLTASGFVDAGSGVYTFTGTPAASTTAIRALVFNPTDNRAASGSTETSTFTISASDGVAAAVTNSATTVISTSINDAPTITGTAVAQAVNDNATVSPFAAVTLADADPSASLTVLVTIDAAAKGAFTPSSLTSTGFVSAGAGIFTFTGSAAAATAAIQGLVFAPNSNRVSPGLTETSTFTVSVSDGIAAAVSNSATTVISTSINDAPVINGAVAAQTVNDTATRAPFTAVTIADADATQSLTVTVTLDIAAKGVFTSASLTASGFVSSGSGVYTFTGTGAAATTAIRALVFAPTANRVAVGSTETTTFTIAANDSIAAAVTNNATTVISTSINDAPTITGAAAAQAVSDNATVSPFSGVTLSDADPSTTLSISVTIDNAAKGVFSSASLTASGFVSAGSGIYTFTGTPAAATTAIRALIFVPAANRVAPSATETSTFIISSSDGVTSAVTSNTTTVISTSANDAPTITGAVAAQAVGDTETRSPFTGITIGDADSAQSLAVSVRVDNAAKGVFTSASLTASGFVSTGAGVYTFTGNAASATAAVRALVFAPTANRVASGSTETSTFTISANDAIAAATTNATTTVISTSINDAPTITGAVGNQAITDNATRAPFTAITIVDVDAPNTQSVSVTLDDATKGTFTPASLTASGFISAGSGIYTFTGSAAAATNAIRALVFAPTLNHVAPGLTDTTTFTISSSDGVAPAATDSATTVVTTNTNDAPIITGTVAGQANAETSTVNPFATVTFADDDSVTALSITVSLDVAAKGIFSAESLVDSGFTSAGAGIYTFSGNAAAATAAIRDLVFAPTDNRVPIGQSETTTFTISATDAQAAVTTSAVTTVISTNVNNAPVIATLTVAPASVNRGTAITLTASGVIDSDSTIARIEFYRDTNGNGIIDVGTDILLGNDTTATAGAYTLSVSTAGFSLGTATFLARAVDSLALAGNAVSATTTVNNVTPTITAVTRSVDPVFNLGDNITLTATGAADADGTIARVEFYRDSDSNGVFNAEIDTLLGSDSSSVGGFTLTTSTSSFATGTNRYFARTIDSDGSASAAVTITGRINAAPTFTTFISATDTIIRRSTLTLSVSGAADTDGTIARVDFYRDANGNGTLEVGTDTLLGSDTIAASGIYSLAFSTAGFATGENTFFARVVDNNTVASAARSVAVTVTNAAPAITAVTRSVDPVVNLGDNITLTATGAADADGTVSRVEFYRDSDNNGVFSVDTDTLLGSDSNATGGYTLTTSTSSFATGTNRYFARTIDNDGAASAAVTVTGRINAAPTFTALAPSASSVARKSSITLTASGAADTDGTITRIEFYRDTNGNGTFEAGTDTLLGSDTTSTGGSYSLIVNTTGFATGANSFFARAIDNNLAASVLRSTSVTVTNLAPALTAITRSADPVVNLGDNITLTGTGPVDADGTIARIEFYRDSDNSGTFDPAIDTLLGSDTNATGGYTLTVSTSTFALGTNRYFARAVDNEGAVSSAVTVTGRINTAPTLAFLAASVADVDRKSVFTLLAGGAADSDGTIARIEFYRDTNSNGTLEIGIDTLLGSDATASAGSYSLDVNTTTFAAGNNVFFARPVDNNLAGGAAQDIIVTVNNLAPTLTSTAAATPRVLQLGNPITFTATGAADADGVVASVKFYRDADGDGVLDVSVDTLLGIDSLALGGWTLTTATSGFAIGANTVFTQVTDSDGATSAPVATNIVVNNAPTLAGISINPSPISRTANYTLTAISPLDTDGTITRIEFYRDRGVLGTFESTVDLLMGAATFSGGIWRLSLAGSGLTAGSHTFFARAQDNNGSWSNVVSITVIAA